jgi:hypothetical protein
MSEIDSTIERWLPCVGFEGSYEVSNKGTVRSLDRFVSHGSWGASRRVRARTLRLKMHKGYASVTLCRDSAPFTVFVHHLVHDGLAFLGGQFGHQSSAPAAFSSGMRD